MKGRLRKLALTAHVASSVGWLGAVAAYLAPALVGLTTSDMDLVRSCHVVMTMMGWFVIVPLALTAVVTGLVQSLFTEWGVIRYYWVATKFVLSIVGVAILVMHMGRTVSGLAALSPVAHVSASSDHLKQHLVVHAVGGIVLLLAATTLSIYKPWGKTRYGKRTTA